LEFLRFYDWRWLAQGETTGRRVSTLVEVGFRFDCTATPARHSSDRVIRVRCLC